MKLKHLFINLLSLLLLPAFAQSESVKKAWEPLLDQPGLAFYFSGVFESLAVTIEETGEQITVLHHGNRFELRDGISEVVTDYSVTLKLANIRNMAEHGKDGKIDDYESYRIMSVLFTPLARAALENPMMNKSFAMKMADIENHAHVYLESPTNDEYIAHTLIFLNKKWMVIEGIHGNAKRVFRMSPDQTLEYQRAVFAAQKENTRRAWKKFMKFYLDWREFVSVEAE